MSEKPLHVQVAEALGEEPCDLWEAWGQGLAGPEWIKRKPCDHPRCYPKNAPPRFDTSWSWTGPLIEKYRLRLEPVRSTGGYAASAGDPKEYPGELYSEAPTPLLAVCNLILALKDAGKL